MKGFLKIVGISFTGCVLFFCVFAKLGLVPSITEDFIFILFFMDSSIAGANMLTNLWEEKRKRETPVIVDYFIRIIECYLIVLLEGCLSGMIPFAPIAFIYISPIIIPVFTGTYIVMLVSAKNSADYINKKINNKK